MPGHEYGREHRSVSTQTFKTSRTPLLGHTTGTSSVSVYPSISSYRKKNRVIAMISDDAGPYGHTLNLKKLLITLMAA